MIRGESGSAPLLSRGCPNWMAWVVRSALFRLRYPSSLGEGSGSRCPPANTNTAARASAAAARKRAVFFVSGCFTSWVIRLWTVFFPPVMVVEQDSTPPAPDRRATNPISVRP